MARDPLPIDAAKVPEARGPGEQSSAVPQLTVFVSSPSDVAKEREMLRAILNRLAAVYEHRVEITAILWEYQPIEAIHSFQPQLPHPSEADLLLCVLWSRLGTPLPCDANRNSSPSGTEFELRKAVEARASGKDRPDILLYIKSAEPPQLPPSHPDYEEHGRQFRAVTDFIDGFIKNQSGELIRGFHSFPNLERFEELVDEHLQQWLAKRLKQAGRATPSGLSWKLGSPFRRLEAFHFEHASIFFGRTASIDEAITRLASHAQSGCNFLLITGASGAGKSSLAQAGLLPLIVRGAIDRGVCWRWAVMRPNDDGHNGPVHALTEALLRPNAVPELRRDTRLTETLSDSVTNAPDALLGLIQAALVLAAETDARHAALAEAQRLRLSSASAESRVAANLENRPRAHLALVIDQMEELFLIGDQTKISQFIHLIALMARTGSVYIIATLRSDFFHDCAKYPELMELKRRGHLDLMPPTPAEISQIIRRPARAAGLALDEDQTTGERLEDTLRDQAAQFPYCLPLLEFTMDELFRLRDPEQNLLTLQAHRDIGGISGAIAKSAEDAYQSLPRDARAQFAVVFHSLLTVRDDRGETPTVVSCQTRIADIPRTPADRPHVDTFLNAFIARRLFVSDDTLVGSTPESHEPKPANAESDADTTSTSTSAVVRIAHDALLDAWPELKTWIDKNRGLIHARTLLAAAANKWQKREGPLLSGAPLLTANQVANAGLFRLTPEEQSFLIASNRKRNGIRILVSAAAILILVLAGTVAHMTTTAALQRAVARQQQYVEKVTFAKQYIDRNQHHLAKEALWQAPEEWRNWEWGHEMLEAGRELLVVQSGADSIGPAVFNTDGSRLLVCLSDSLLTIPSRFSIEDASPAEQQQSSTETGSPDAAPGEWPIQIWDALEGVQLSTLHETAKVGSAQFNKDGTRILTRNFEGTARLWNALNGDEVAAIRDTENTFFSVVFSRDGERVLAKLDSGVAEVRDAATGEQLFQLTAAPYVTQRGTRGQPHPLIQFSPDGNRILVERETPATTVIFDAKNGRELATFPWRTQLASAKPVFSHDNALLLGGPPGEPATIWDANTTHALTYLRGHIGGAGFNTFSPDGTRILTNLAGTPTSPDPDSNQGMALWDATTGGLVMPLQGFSFLGFNHGLFSPDGRTFIAKPDWESIALLDAKTGNRIADLFKTDMPVSPTKFSPDSKRIAGGMFSGAVRIWDGWSGDEIQTLLGHRLAVSFVDFSPDGARLLTSSFDGTAKLFDAASTPARIAIGTNALFGPVAINPDGSTILTPSYLGRDGGARLWDVTSGACAIELLGHTAPVYAVAYGPDGKQIITASYDGTARLWDAMTGEALRTLRANSSSVATAAILASGNLVLTADFEGAAWLWDANSGEKRTSLAGHTRKITAVSFTPDGTLLMTGSDDKSARIWDLTSGRQRAAFGSLDDSVTAVALVPKAARALTGTGHAAWDKVVQLWDLDSLAQVARFTKCTTAPSVSSTGDRFITVTEVSQQESDVVVRNLHSGDPVFSLRGHTKPVAAASYSPDASRIVTASDDGTVRIWDAESGRELLALAAPENLPVSNARFSAQGRHILAELEDGSVAVWEAAPWSRAAFGPDTPADPSEFQTWNRRRLATAGLRSLELKEEAQAAEIVRNAFSTLLDKAAPIPQSIGNP